MDSEAKSGLLNWLPWLLNTWRAVPTPNARRRLAQLQDDAARLDDVTRARIGRIRALDADVRRHGCAPDVPGFARRALTEAVREMEPLALRAADLACRRGDLAVLLENVNMGALRRELSALRVRREQAVLTDPVLQAQLDQALRFKNEERAAYQAIEQTLRRVDGQLESVECAFAAFKARVLRLKAGDEVGGAPWSETLGESLETDVETLSRQMDALDGSVREVLAVGRGGAAHLFTSPKDNQSA